jgi:hypothetical protein
MSSHTATTKLVIETTAGGDKPTQKQLCPGWEDTLQIGFFPEVQDSCRPCNSKEESWVAVEFNDNIGISACLPDPIDVVSTHKHGIVYVGIMVAVYCLVYFRKATKKTRR